MKNLLVGRGQRLECRCRRGILLEVLRVGGGIVRLRVRGELRGENGEVRKGGF